MATQESPSQPMTTSLPIPPDFPVSWEQPGDAQLFWTFDPTLPDAMTPLDYSFVRDALHGFNAAARVYELPMRLETRHINTYLYQAATSIATDGAPLPSAVNDPWSHGQLSTAVANLGELWSASWLPEIKAHLDHWRATALHTLPLAALRSHLNDTLVRAQRMWDIHFELVFPVLLAISLFEELYNDLFEPEDAFEAYRLLQGFDNKTLEADRALWHLSRRVLVSAGTREAFRLPAADILPALERSAASNPVSGAFLSELRAFLVVYGRRSNYMLLNAPTWAEDPTPVLANLQQYIGQPDRDPLAELVALETERNHQVAAARGRLEGYPGPVREQFEALLMAAQTATMLSEEHTYWLDYAILDEVRRVFLEYGRRLASDGRIDQPADVFFLTLDELREHAGGTSDPARRTLVTRRKADLEHFRGTTPPSMLGTAPTELPADNPLDRALGKFAGTPPEVSSDPHILRGHAGAPGSASGPARVIHSLADAGRVQPGDVLVAPATLPAWTPLFATVAAVVTDAGGILSHCAVVAREYRIPAVVGTGTATTSIRDGQMIEVDGTSGVVRLGSDQ